MAGKLMKSEIEIAAERDTYISTWICALIFIAFVVYIALASQ